MGRPPVITPTIRKLLVEHATASQQNRSKTLLEIAEDLGVSVNKRTLRKAFADEGYHRQVARIKPFLSITAKVQRLAWAGNIKGPLGFWDKAWGPTLNGPRLKGASSEYSAGVGKGQRDKEAANDGLPK
ncbi:uncharacterized protein H6S33_007079 [Morchella sextelata]|uniref:uncharacterized protein n=1 Tax=Morchella sextelata TaxID=1174677 RepID=UPI001D046675|nr:uncharacterized protein H6S33_007079 [Morchella sextelata]KAH0604048.1 hypothetical protein H6S33_007079 [Morchella sextelata]